MRTHIYHTALDWTGNLGKGTQNYRAYARDYRIRIEGKPSFHGSADPTFLGNPEKYNPEEMFVASLSACHMLWYLHLCAEAEITVVEYTDLAEGFMQQNSDGSGQFERVVLQPEVMILQKDKAEQAMALHKKAHQMCFIARSCNFEVANNPKISVV